MLYDMSSKGGTLGSVSNYEGYSLGSSSDNVVVSTSAGRVGNSGLEYRYWVVKQCRVILRTIYCYLYYTCPFALTSDGLKNKHNMAMRFILPSPMSTSLYYRGHKFSHSKSHLHHTDRTPFSPTPG